MSVYGIFDEAGVCLYVGVSQDHPIKRWVDHLKAPHAEWLERAVRFEVLPDRTEREAADRLNPEVGDRRWHRRSVCAQRYEQWTPFAVMAADIGVHERIPIRHECDGNHICLCEDVAICLDCDGLNRPPFQHSADCVRPFPVPSWEGENPD